MITYNCDCCRNKIDGRVYELSLLRHITNKNLIFEGHVTIIDGKTHPISSVSDKIDLCLVCYNEIMYKTYDFYKELKEKNN